MAEEDDKPGMGVSGVATGVVGGAVGAGGTALIAHQMKKGKLSEDGKKLLDKTFTADELKAAEDTFKGKFADAAAHENALKAELAALGGKETDAAKEWIKKSKANEMHAAGKESKAVYDQAIKEARANPVIEARDALVKDGKMLKSDYAEKIGKKGAEEFEKAAKDTAKKVEGAAAKATTAAEASTIKIAGEAEKIFDKTRAVKDASWIKKPIVAFQGMSGKGKALAIGVGAVLAIGGAMWMKARHQNAWQERIESERAAAMVAAPQPAR